METTTSVMLGVVSVFLAAAGARAESCFYYNSEGDHGLMFCDSACCGDEYDRYCCTWGAGTVAGTAIGCAVLVTVLVVIIVRCRRRRLAGRVIYTQQPGLVINAGPMAVKEVTRPE